MSFDFFSSDIFGRIFESKTKVLDILFYSSYYPVHYFCNCLFICFYLRVASPPHTGLQWWRSLILGFLLSYAPRKFFGWLIFRNLPEENSSLYLTYFIAWSILNICPFDLVYNFILRTVPRVVVGTIAEFGCAQLLIHYTWNAINSFPDKPFQSIYIVVSVYLVNIVIEYIDNLIFSPRRKFNLYNLPYVKRIFVFTSLVVLLTTPNKLINFKPIEMYHFLPIYSTLFALLKILDAVSSRANPFNVLDLFFPNILLEKLFTYHSSKDTLNHE